MIEDKKIIAKFEEEFIEDVMKHIMLNKITSEFILTGNLDRVMNALPEDSRDIIRLKTVYELAKDQIKEDDKARKEITTLLTSLLSNSIMDNVADLQQKMIILYHKHIVCSEDVKVTFIPYITSLVKDDVTEYVTRYNCDVSIKTLNEEDNATLLIHTSIPLGLNKDLLDDIANTLILVDGDKDDKKYQVYSKKELTEEDKEDLEDIKEAIEQGQIKESGVVKISKDKKKQKTFIN